MIPETNSVISEPKPLKTDNKHIVIRMYNVGFGDSFLISFPAKDRPRKVLIDCGVHFSGKNPEVKFEDVIGQIISDVKEKNSYKIDIVIATHRHQDHVSGFEDPRWDDVEVEQVWMPWTEDYRDPEAAKILKKQSSTAKKLNDALSLILENPTKFGLNTKNKKRVQEIKDFSENSLKNAKAMNTLHNGFKGKSNIERLYLPYKKRESNIVKSDLLPGVKAYIIGPSRDPEVIRDMEPLPSEHWFGMINDIGANKNQILQPFNAGWSIEADSFDPNNSVLSKSEKDQINNIGEGTELGIAVRLEKAVNGTSLMIMFQMGDAYLLFPGDAQNGTWQSALKDEEWRDLLTKTNFYKVGHHGSHNATPKEFVNDVLQSNCRAMTSVYPVKEWKYIPKTELMKALRDKSGKVIRSDKPDEKFDDPLIFNRTKFYVETKIPI